MGKRRKTKPSGTLGPRNVRAAAWRVLGRLSYRPHGARELVGDELAGGQWRSPDRGLLTELVYGTIKRRLTLDAILRAYVSRPWASVDPRVGDLLRLAVYQIVLLERVPRYAVVNETVETCRQVGLGQAARFVNGVLRALCRDAGPDLTSERAPGAIPVWGGRWRPCARNVLEAIDPDSVEYLSRAYSFPAWLLERWLARMDGAAVARLCDWFNSPPPLCLRVNPPRTTRDEALAALTAAGFTSEPAEHPLGVRVLHRAAPTELPGFEAGWWTVQDASAMQVVGLMDLQPGWHVLDACAAPGGKTTQAAAAVGPAGSVVACDVRPDGLRQVRENCRRLGLANVQCREVGQKAGADWPEGPFDAVLVDAPCSNTGVLGRRAEARWRLQAEHLTRLCELQGQLLESAYRRVRPGGLLVYATCSIEPEENAALVDEFLTRRADLAREAEKAFEPGPAGDGGWAVRLRRGVE